MGDVGDEPAQAGGAGTRDAATGPAHAAGVVSPLRYVPAEPREDRRTVPAPLVVLLGIGIVVHAALAMLFWGMVRGGGVLADPPGSRVAVFFYHAFDWYLVVGALWSVTIGFVGLLWGNRARTRFGGYGSSARAGWCLLGVWTGIVWPLPMTAALVLLAVRPRSWFPRETAPRRGWRIACAASAAVVVATGPLCGIRGYAEQLGRARIKTTADLYGTWRAEDGAVLVLGGDGSFVASGLSDDATTLPRGSWTESDGDVELSEAVGGPLRLGIYRAAGVWVLCKEGDPDSPCSDGVFLR